MKKIKTHCRHGHEWVPENIYTLPATGTQSCLLCKKESALRTALKNGKGKGRAKILQTHCKRGHEFTEDNIYYAPDGGRVCKECRKERNRKTRLDRKNDPVHQQNMRDGRARWREKNPDYHKFHDLLIDYKITPERYHEMIAEQDGKCAVCLCPLPEVVHLDHDHSCCDRNRKTCGECVRGLLCPLCNQGLGQFKDSEERLLRAIEYLRKYRKTE